MLNNREIAIATWVVIVLALGLRKAKVRESFSDVLKALAHRKILLPLLLAVAYVCTLILGLHEIGIWTPALVKDTIFWFVFTGAVAAFSLIGSWKGDSLLRSFAVDALKITIVVEFFTSEYTLSLPAELLLVLVLFALGGMDAVAGDNPRYVPAKRLIRTFQVALGLMIVAVAIRHAVEDWENLQTLATLWKFLLPPMLSLLFVPFAYGLLLYSLYESLFSRLHVGAANDPAFRAHARRRLLVRFGLNLRALHRFSESEGRKIWSVRSTADLNALLDTQPSPALPGRAPQIRSEMG